jgi:hypothetical protein
MRYTTILAAAAVGVAFLSGTTAAFAYSAVTTVATFLRSGPGDSYAASGHVQRGDPAEVKDCHDDWCLVVVDGQNGWISWMDIETTDVGPSDAFFPVWSDFYNHSDFFGDFPHDHDHGAHGHPGGDVPHDGGAPHSEPHDGGSHGGGEHAH